MSIETIADVDTRIDDFRWRWLHCVWDATVDEVELAKLAIDVLLERRHEIMHAAAPPDGAALNAVAQAAHLGIVPDQGTPATCHPSRLTGPGAAPVANRPAHGRRGNPPSG
jgi:hypothetical protein